jgi:DNA-binding GntR family transcriptional regulator
MTRSSTLAVQPLRRDSVGQQAYRALRRALLGGELEPGRLYSENHIAELLTTSRTPVRQALRRFELEGLVEIFPQRGFRFRSVQPAEIEEYYDLRELLEVSVVRTLCTVGADGSLDDAIRGAERIVQRQEQSATEEEFLEIDEEFHVYLADIASRPRTAQMIASLRGILWFLGARVVDNPERRAAVLGEHRRIVEALLAHDAEAAVAAMTAHVRESHLALAASSAGQAAP